MLLLVVRLRWVSVLPDSGSINRTILHSASQTDGAPRVLSGGHHRGSFFDFLHCLTFLVIVSAILPHRLKGWDLGVCFPRCVLHVTFFTDLGDDLLNSFILLHLLPKLARILDIHWMDLMHPWPTLQRYRKLDFSFTKNEIIIRKKI